MRRRRRADASHLNDHGHVDGYLRVCRSPQMQLITCLVWAGGAGCFQLACVIRLTMYATRRSIFVFIFMTLGHLCQDER
jgi:hypothetical protein